MGHVIRTCRPVHEQPSRRNHCHGVRGRVQADVFARQQQPISLVRVPLV